MTHMAVTPSEGSNVIPLRPPVQRDIRTPKTTIRAHETTGKVPEFPIEHSIVALPLSSSGVEAHTDVSCVRANAMLGKAEFQAVVRRLSATDLTKRFSLDYSSWKDMHGRRRNGCEIALEFRNFRSFLRHMGVPRPNAEWTVTASTPSGRNTGRACAAGLLVRYRRTTGRTPFT